MIYIILIIAFIAGWIIFKPSLEATRDNDLLLFYNTKYGRDYVRLFKL